MTQVSRDYQTGDGAYVLVAPAKGALKKVVSDKIFAADGKYGSYGAPADVRLARSENRGDGDEVFEYTFVALTPARRGVRTRTRRGRRVDGVGTRNARNREHDAGDARGRTTRAGTSDPGRRRRRLHLGRREHGRAVAGGRARSM